MVERPKRPNEYINIVYVYIHDEGTLSIPINSKQFEFVVIRLIAIVHGRHSTTTATAMKASTKFTKFIFYSEVYLSLIQ